MHVVFIFTNMWCVRLPERTRVHVFGVIDVYFFIPCFYQCLFRLKNHIYKAFWDSHLGEELVCRRERSNIRDLFEVPVLKRSDIIVGRVLRAISVPVMYSTINCN